MRIVDIYKRCNQQNNYNRSSTLRNQMPFLHFDKLNDHMSPGEHRLQWLDKNWFGLDLTTL